MQEVGLWDIAFDHVLIYHDLSHTTFTFNRDAQQYEFVYPQNYPGHFVLILREPLIRAQVWNPNFIPCPPQMGHTPSFPPAELKPMTWSKQFLAANKAREQPLSIHNCPPDFRPTYHHVPKPVLDVL